MVDWPVSNACIGLGQCVTFLFVLVSCPSPTSAVDLRLLCELFCTALMGWGLLFHFGISALDTMG